MRILIVGNLGMLGTDLMREASLRHEVQGVDREELDITDRRQCLDFLKTHRPDIVINAAALTQVDYCETHEQEALLVNGEGAGNLAEAAASIDSFIAHFSTDYVFDGLKDDAYQEDDPPNPRSAYGRSKLWGEQMIRLHAPHHLILRTAWLFGMNGSNFIRTILAAARGGQSLRVVKDQKGSPTYSRDLASHTMRLIESGCRGTYHLTNSGSCTWFQLAVCAVEWAGMKDVQVTATTTAEIARPAPRPANSVLANNRLAQEGFPPMRPWQEAAREYVALLQDSPGALANQRGR